MVAVRSSGSVAQAISGWVVPVSCSATWTGRGAGDQAAKSSPHHPAYTAHTLHLFGDIASHPERFDAGSGEAYYRQALALAEPRGMHPLAACCHLSLGKLFRRIGKRAQAKDHLTTATTMYREMDMPFWLEQAEAELGELGIGTAHDQSAAESAIGS